MRATRGDRSVSEHANANTQQQAASTYSPCDRFIPSRTALNGGSRGRLSAPSARANDSGAYDCVLRNQLLGISPARGGVMRDPSVLQFHTPGRTSPAQPSPDLADSALKRAQAALPLLRREVPCANAQRPDLVLDAPNLRDDFYASLLDWSKQNIVSVAIDTDVWLWHGSNAQRTCLLQRTGTLLTSVAFSGRGTYLAVGMAASQLEVWDAGAQKLLRCLPGHGRRIGALAWARALLASGSRDRSVLLHDVRDSAPAQRLRWHKAEVCGLKWSPDGNHLASGGNDNSVAVWDRRALSQPVATLQHDAAVRALAWSPHRRGLLATGAGTADRHIRLWNTVSSKCTAAFDTGSQVCSLVFSPTVDEVASSHGYTDNHVGVWAVPSLSKVAVIKAHEARVCYMALSPDGQMAVTGAGAGDETLRFWSLFRKHGRSTLSAVNLGRGLERAHIR